MRFLYVTEDCNDLIGQILDLTVIQSPMCGLVFNGAICNILMVRIWTMPRLDLRPTVRTPGRLRIVTSRLLWLARLWTFACCPAMHYAGRRVVYLIGQILDIGCMNATLFICVRGLDALRARSGEPLIYHDNEPCIDRAFLWANSLQRNCFAPFPFRQEISCLPTRS